MKVQVNICVLHLDAKHILKLITGDNKIPDLIRMQPEIKNGKKKEQNKTFRHTRNTNMNPNPEI